MWRNKADNMICVYRPDMMSSQTMVFVDKIRFRRNGRVAFMQFNFHVGSSTYHPMNFGEKNESEM